LRTFYLLLCLVGACSSPAPENHAAQIPCAERYKQISATPREDARRAARVGDRRFILVGGPTLAIPPLRGKQFDKAFVKGGYRSLSGLTDDAADPCFQFSVAADSYATEYNQEMASIVFK